MTFQQSSEEKIKPFRLVKYFTFASMILIFMGTFVLSILNTYWAKTMQLKKSEDYAVLLVENLNHQVFMQFIIPVAMQFGKIQLRNKDQFEHMDKVVKSTFHSFKVDMVNIYDMSGVISYSFNKDLIGKENASMADFKNALSGKSTSKLIQRGNIWEIMLGFSKESKLVTFSPLRAEKPLSTISGPVLGVFEITQDLSDDYKRIFNFQISVIITCAVVLGTLFMILFFVVKRGESIIQRRTQERLKLKEQLSRAERLSSMGEMTARISHEIRNPLGIIMSSAGLLKKKMAQFDPSNTVPNIIVEEAGRLNNIITDSLNFTKVVTPNLFPYHIKEILEKNINFLEPQLEKQGHKIETNYADNLPMIMADSAMLYQAFLNILINAAESMPNGGKVYIEIKSMDNAIIIIFEDEGEGISENVMKKIWDPFFTTKEKGTGLGLGIVKNIIESHGGNISISNNSKQGAIVVIKLPIKIAR